MEDPATEAPQPSPVTAAQEEPEQPKQSEPSLPPSGFKKFALDYWSQCQSILLKPVAFFDTMPTTGGILQPVKFVLIAAGINGVMTGLVSLNPGSAVATFGLTMIGMFLCSVVASGLSSMMGGKGNFEGTLRIFAYSEATLLFQWVRAVGVLAWLYTCVLNYMGLRRIQQLGEFQTLVVVLLSGVIAAVFVLLGACGMLIRANLHF